MGGLCYAFCWIIANFKRINVFLAYILVIGDPIILIHCVRVLWKLIKSDYLKYYGSRGVKKALKAEQKANGGYLLFPEYKIK